MTPIGIILISFVLSFVFVVCLYLYESFKKKSYWQRKQDDHRQFNENRSKPYWRK